MDLDIEGAEVGEQRGDGEGGGEEGEGMEDVGEVGGDQEGSGEEDENEDENVERGGRRVLAGVVGDRRGGGRAIV